MEKFDVMVVGDANIDLVVEGLKCYPPAGQEVRVKNMSTNVGGGAALCAMGLSKLGLKTAFYGILGNDLYGNFVIQQLKSINIETYPIKISESKGTGISIALFGEKDRSFITYDGSNSEVDLNKVDMEIVKRSRHVHITGYNSRKHESYLKFIRNLKEAGVTVSTDVGWDETGEWYEGLFELISYVDVFFINEIEVLNYTRCKTAEEGLKKLSQYCRIVAVKMGSRGACAIQDGEIVKEGALDVEVVDTTGAGDSFNAGFLYGFLKGADLKKCLQYGNACGGFSVTKAGGNTAFPDSKTLEAFIQQASAKVGFKFCFS